MADGPISQRAVIHSLAEARAALAAAKDGSTICLVSAPDAGAYAGVSWFKSLINMAKKDYPAVAVEAVLDCGAAAGSALAALRAGVKRVVFSGNERARARLADIATALGATLESR